ncbi:protein YgfX [Psychrobacter lutiphocae]|uniref:protein YgfX n=1 Tax=Psychrobacter lutiphocae TaxID=540500 RepID=UPI00037FAD99|nr:protein YgfX [Psychrobacter lutiphocae]
MSRKLATDIKRFSIFQHIYGMMLLLLSLGVLFTLDVSWIWMVSVSLISVMLYILVVMRMRNQPLHMTLVDVNASRGEWQLLYPGYDKPILWQAQMLAIQSMRYCVLLTFQTQYPSARKKMVVIWQDQVSADVWRCLKVLSR